MKVFPGITLTLLSIIPSLIRGDGDVVSLNPKNYDTITAGKAVFIKFFAPWCGHCKAMAADFEKLASEHKSNTDKLIAEVDCTDENAKALCQDNGVKGFPTLKYGNPMALEDYQGGRDFQAMNDFVQSTLKVSCSAFNVALCNDDEKALIEKVQKMSSDELNEEIQKVEKLLDEADKALEAGIEQLQQKFEAMMTEHEKEMEDMKAKFDYKLKKSILAMKKKEAGIVDDAAAADDDDDDDYDDDDANDEL